jgi:hypothetical protein
MTTDLIIDAFKMLLDISYSTHIKYYSHGYDEQITKFKRERAVTIKNGKLSATSKRLYTGEDKRLTAASAKALLINDTPIEIELLKIAEGQTAELKDLLAFSNNGRGFQLIEDEEYHSSEKLDELLGAGNYTFMVTYGDWAGQKRLYVKIDIVNEYMKNEDIVEEKAPEDELIASISTPNYRIQEHKVSRRHFNEKGSYNPRVVKKLYPLYDHAENSLFPQIPIDTENSV